MEEATKCLFRTSLRSTHSTRMCFTVSGHWQVPHSGKSSPESRKECVKRVWPIRSLFSNTVSRARKLSPSTLIEHYIITHARLIDWLMSAVSDVDNVMWRFRVCCTRTERQSVTRWRWTVTCMTFAEHRTSKCLTSWRYRQAPGRISRTSTTTPRSRDHRRCRISFLALKSREVYHLKSQRSKHLPIFRSLGQPSLPIPTPPFPSCNRRGVKGNFRKLPRRGSVSAHDWGVLPTILEYFWWKSAH